jgi:hypothetical protein
MQRLTLHIPEVLRDGTPVPPQLHASYEDELLDIALDATLESGVGEPGLTIVGNVVGAWQAPDGTRHRESMRLLIVDVANSQGLVEHVLRLVDRIRDELDQYSVYVTATAVEAMTVTGYVAA